MFTYDDILRGYHESKLRKWFICDTLDHIIVENYIR